MTDATQPHLNQPQQAPIPHPFLITLLGPAITAAHQHRIRAILAAHGLKIAHSDQLTASLAPTREPFNAALSWTLSGVPVDEHALRAELLAAATDLSIDIALQHNTPHRTSRRLFVFDMDSTLIQGEVIDELAKLAGVGEEVSRITEAAMRGELNFDQSFTRRVGLLKGLPAEQALALRERIPLSPGAERLFAALKSRGYYTAILSGGFTFFASSLQARLGIDEFHANELEITDGKVTGRVIPPIMNGARKARMLAEIAARENIPLEEAVAVGDGANDLPMMELAGMGIAYRAKPIVRQQADHSLASLGLDGLLYLIGLRDQEPDAPTTKAVSS
jgi:phosphoserine phosphatase